MLCFITGLFVVSRSRQGIFSLLQTYECCYPFGILCARRHILQIVQRWKEYSYIFFTIADLYIIKGLDACEPHHISRYLYYDEHTVILLAFRILYTVLNQIQIYFFKERILHDILVFVLLYHELQMVVLWCLYTKF